MSGRAGVAAPNASHQSGDTRRLLLAAGLVLGVVALSVLFWQVGHVLLLFFASVLFAVFLDAISGFLERWTGCSRALGMTATLSLIGAALAAMGLFAGPAIAEQSNELIQRIPQALEDARRSLEGTFWGGLLLRGPSGLDAVASPGSGFVQALPGAFKSVFGILVELVVVLLIGVYLAADPRVYLGGALHLVPASARPRVAHVFGLEARALRAWLLGRIASMSVVAVLTAAGLWGVGSPLAFVLGVIAGLLSFVPYIGPVVAAAPGILVAVSDGPTQVLQVTGVYVGVQVLESNAITPLIQWHAVALPPALLLAAQMVMAVLFGALGVLVATPLLVALIVLVQALYVRQVLGDEEVGVLPDRAGDESRDGATPGEAHAPGHGPGH